MMTIMMIGMDNKGGKGEMTIMVIEDITIIIITGKNPESPTKSQKKSYLRT